MLVDDATTSSPVHVRFVYTLISETAIEYSIPCSQVLSLFDMVWMTKH